MSGHSDYRVLTLAPPPSSGRPGSVFYIKYDKTFFPCLNYAGEEKKFDALFPRGGLCAAGQNEIWTSHYITEHSKRQVRKSGNSVHLTTSRNTRCVATLATLVRSILFYAALCTGIDACAPNPRNNAFQASLHSNIHTYRHRCLCAKPKE